jgi:hypothetical protein
MDEPQPPLIKPTDSEPAQPSLRDDLRQLVADGRTLLEAELAYQKSRAVVAGQGAKGVAGWGLLALALVFFTLMALVMGLLLALEPVLGGWGAMALVVLVLLGATGLSAWLASRSWQRAARHLADQDEPQ